MHTARLLLAFALCACGSQEGDPPSTGGIPPAAGKDQRIHEIADPESPLKAAHEQTVAVSGAVVVAVDQFDETNNGRSSGTIYVSDLGSTEAYSGISLFNPSFIPGNLRVSPGDALDLRGQFQENEDVPQKFAPGAALVQIANPIGTFRFETALPDAVAVKIGDFFEYKTGRRWLNMLVTIEDVTIHGEAFGGSGRRSYNLMPPIEGAPIPIPCSDPFPKVPTLVNELTDLSSLELRNGTKIKKLTGIVTFFCNLHIAPRTPADVEVER